MTRENKRKSNRQQMTRQDAGPSRLLSGTNPVVRMSAKYLIQLSLAAGTGTRFTLQPSALFGTVANVAIGFELYRFTRIEMMLHSPQLGQSTSNTSSYSVGYYPVPQGTSSSTGNVYDATVSRFMSGSDTTPQLMVVDRKALQGARQWFMTDNSGGNGSAVDLQQGIILVDSVSAATSINIELGVEIEFKGPTNAAVGRVALEAYEQSLQTACVFDTAAELSLAKEKAQKPIPITQSNVGVYRR